MGDSVAAKLKMDFSLSAGPVTVVSPKALIKQSTLLVEQAPEWFESITNDLPESMGLLDVEIRLVKHTKDLQAVAPPGRQVPSWASGVMFPGTNIVAVALRSDQGLLNYQSTARHELAHLALDRALGKSAKRWLHEGFAYVHSSEWEPERVNTLAAMAWSGNVFPFSDIDRRFPKAESAVNKAYAQSYDFVAFLARRGLYKETGASGNRWPLRVFLKEISNGSTYNDAALFAYGVSFVALENEWYENLRARYLMIPSSLFGGLCWVLAAFALVFGFFRKKRTNNDKLDRWEKEEEQWKHQVAFQSTPVNLHRSPELAPTKTLN